ncbi:Metallo-beta-lactamase superfamily [Absidia repens]|uniref:hydroxyacylglutathione hydrolase n=1 Tax=Absidia repens TaxID=90262 RepID=A0A1X2IVU2_9FUNG|nr:Metallo-beta-lactamase superfamily [Absidia repens]
MIIKPVPCLQDNYSYILLDEKSKLAAVVDPVEPSNILIALEEYPDYRLTTVLTTHHHWDHAGGNNELKKQRPGLTVYGGSKEVEGVTSVIDIEQPLELGSLRIQPYLTRGHTMDHVCYYVQQQQQQQDDNQQQQQQQSGAVFTGDCLFSSGCGRFFEGTPTDMDNALTKLKHLPENTDIYFGHEYTAANCKFALTVEPDNTHLQQKLEWARSAGCTTPSTVLNESLTVRAKKK